MSPIRPHFAELARRHEEQEHEARRATRADLIRTLLAIVAATLLGMTIMGLALWIADEAYGRMLWWGGMVVWVAGDALAILGFYQRGVRRGDW